jgi:hypothetical protein
MSGRHLKQCRLAILKLGLIYNSQLRASMFPQTILGNWGNNGDEKEAITTSFSAKCMRNQEIHVCLNVENEVPNGE